MQLTLTTIKISKQQEPSQFDGKTQDLKHQEKLEYLCLGNLFSEPSLEYAEPVVRCW